MKKEDRDRIAALKALFSTGHYCKCVLCEVLSITTVIMWKYKIYKHKKPQKYKKKSTNLLQSSSNIICLLHLPHVLIYITPDIFTGKASWEESFGMPYPPLAVFSCDILAWTFHLKNLPSPGWEKLLSGAEERGVRDKEKWHRPQMDVKPGCDCTGMVECHIVPCDHIY